MNCSNENVVYPPFNLKARVEGEGDMQFMDHMEESEEEKTDQIANKKGKKKKGKAAEMAAAG